MTWFAFSTNKYPLLPVVDKAGQLISFAYKENDANRELRRDFNDKILGL